MRRYRVALFLLSLIILGLIILISNPAELARKLSLSNPFYIVLGLAVSTAANVFRVLKWSVLVNVKFLDLAPIQMLGMTVSNFTPGKVAEPAKTLLLKMKSGINVSQSLPSVIWERINDVVVLLLFSFVVIRFLPLSQNFLIVGWMSMLIFSAAVIMFLVILKNKHAGFMFFRFLRRLPVGNKLPGTFAGTFYKSRIRKRKIFLGTGLTLIAWTLEGLILYLSFVSLGVNPPDVAILAGMIALSALVGVVSTLPGGLGSFEAVMLLMIAPFGITGSTGVAGVLLYRFLSFWYAAFLGGLSFLYLTRKLNLNKLW
ncbi:MAG: flippase-like domain-containing protein [Candidatus Aenigmarchaeota archaeon]|nr:flippase-like domain-containing protein [Candidatus Aenigmarchaeota archaeon]